MAIETEIESPAIKALGPLFKLTEVLLWDDNAATSTSSKDLGRTLASEEMELSQQMNALGLPISFTTSKKGVARKAKRKITNVKLKSSDEDYEDEVIDVSEVIDGEVVSAINFHDNTNISLCCIPALGRSENCYSDIAEVGKPHCSSNGGPDSMEEICEEIVGMVETFCGDYDPAPCEIILDGYTEVATDLVIEDGETFQRNDMERSCMEKQLVSSEDLVVGHCDSEAEKPCVDNEEQCILDSGVSSHSLVVTDHILKDKYDNCQRFGDIGEWRVFWDDFYMRPYFYNINTQESTWSSPAGVEYVTSSECEPSSSDCIIDATKKDVDSVMHSFKVLDQSDLQDRSHLLVEITDNLSGHSSVETSSGSDSNVGNVISGMDVATVCCSNQHSDELTDSSDIKQNSDGEAKIYSISNTQDDIDSALISKEDWTCDLQKAFKDSKTDERDAYEQLRKLEKVISYEDPQDLADISVNQVSDAERLTTTASKVSEGIWSDIQPEYVSPGTAIDDSERQQHPVPGEMKKKKIKKNARRTRIQRRPSDCDTEFQGMPQELPDEIFKYWCQRYSLFSRFDDGIIMDKEGWFSVTPESIAKHHATRCGGGTVIDSFTGVGGNAIQLAKRGNHVIAIDIDPERLEHAQHNAIIYQVDGNIDFIKGDFFQLAPKMKADTVFLSPPWGGPDYAKVQNYNIKTMLKPHDGYFLFNTSRIIASRIIMFLPRNVDFNQLAEIALSVDPPWALEVEKNYLNGKLKGVTAYFTNTSQ